MITQLVHPSWSSAKYEARARRPFFTGLFLSHAIEYLVRASRAHPFVMRLHYDRCTWRRELSKQPRSFSRFLSLIICHAKGGKRETLINKVQSFATSCIITTDKMADGFKSICYSFVATSSWSLPKRCFRRLCSVVIIKYKNLNWNWQRREVFISCSTVLKFVGGKASW